MKKLLLSLFVFTVLASPMHAQTRFLDEVFSTYDTTLNIEYAQNMSYHNGKVIRIKDNGDIPADNPFVSMPNAKPEIWSYGHRNIQGLAIHPETNELWSHEHGPKGGDEINIIKKGEKNVNIICRNM